MTKAIPFQTRARTIDHLGREQIADVPTAVSELWKNAYDAYAKHVALHIYDHKPPLAAIFDDGHGMDLKQFTENWLVVGTESKASGATTSAMLRNGLKERPKQGQKGIGRLSVAALGSAILVVTKQLDAPFVACLIDWRLFENPYLFLQDVRLPVSTFLSLSHLQANLPDMTMQLLENLDGSSGPPDRAGRLKLGWATFSQLERESNKNAPLTSDEIKNSAKGYKDYPSFLADWSVSKMPTTSGTAMIMMDINASLSAWLTNPTQVNSDESLAIRASLTRTLSGFSDPYTENNDKAIDYKVIVHNKSESRSVISSEEGYGIEFLRGLEHSIEGKFDEHGVFRGQLRAFGKDFGKIEIVPSLPPNTAMRDRVGPFSISIGSFEGDPGSSTHAPAVYSKIDERGDTHGGLYLYRDGLRVMPYGRPENDFFKIEERRTSKAGREFWSSRKLFGRIVISRESNPNLRDKAGREGLIDNAASRALQVLVIDLLKTTARRYFGGESELRGELLPAIQAENSAAAKKAKAAGSSQLRVFKEEVNRCTVQLNSAMPLLEQLELDIHEAVLKEDAIALWAMRTRIDELVSTRAELRLPPKPKTLGRFESTYRSYRNNFIDAADRISELRKVWMEVSERLESKPAGEIARSQFGSNQKLLLDRLAKWTRSINSVLTGEMKRIDEKISTDRKAFYKAAAPILDDVEQRRTSLATALAEMDLIRDTLDGEFANIYDPYLRSLNYLSDGIDLDSAISYSGDRSETLERKIEQIQGLAQIGISVEILSHELETLDRRLSVSLLALPDSVRKLKQFNDADNARRELVERLRFLSQLQISNGDVKSEIFGQDISNYLRAFFEGLLISRDIKLVCTEQFLSSSFFEFPSRIYPVFINLINNSMYWLSKSEVREIRLSVSEDRIIISDSGVGIDQEDIPSLFELFFTKRVRGRGVGLYLCKQTLASGGNEIYYATSPHEKILPGANFVIKLRNGFHA